MHLQSWRLKSQGREHQMPITSEHKKNHRQAPTQFLFASAKGNLHQNNLNA